MKTVIMVYEKDGEDIAVIKVVDDKEAATFKQFHLMAKYLNIVDTDDKDKALAACLLKGKVHQVEVKPKKTSKKKEPPIVEDVVNEDNF